MAIRNFLFHRVSPAGEEWSLPMTPKAFERCVKNIKKNFEVRAVEELVQAKDLKKYKKKNVATFSFDDGFKDNIEYAAPILKKYGCKASFYVVTNSVEKGELNWSHILPKLFLETSKLDLKLSVEGICNIDVQFSSVQQRVIYGKQLYQYMRNVPSHHAEAIMEKLVAYFNDVEKSSGYMMNWKDLNELKNDGFYIGAHTKSHPFLSKIIKKEVLEEELKYPFFKIKEMCGHYPLIISYPSGDYSEHVKKVAKEIGYRYGLVVGQRELSVDNIDLMELPRIDLYADSEWWKNYLRIHNYLLKINKMLKK